MQLFGNDLLVLLVRTLVATFVTRFILDIATSWVAYESRPTLIINVLAGWCLAVVFAAYACAGGLGAIAAVVACIIHIADILRERRSSPSGRIVPRP
ncbi:MAG TPA: hypothetical protein VGK19_02230 [Capsulimonadaceae bacterium]|jgi:hypothetical protein